jgi:Phage integrase family
MSVPPLLYAAARRRSPVTLPGYLAGRPPRNKGLRYPPDPPTVEEIVAVMRQAGDGVHGARLRALIALLWRAGLRINEALTLTEHDLDARGGAVLVRHGKGGRRRDVGMDPWGWDHLRPWLEFRMAMPVGPLLCVVDGPTRGRPWASDAARAQLRRVAAKAGVRRRFAPHQLRHAHAVELAHEGRPAQRHPAPTGPHEPRRHLDLSARDRQRRDHRHRPRPQGANDPRHHWAPPHQLIPFAIPNPPDPLASKSSTVNLRFCPGVWLGSVGGAVGGWLSRVADGRGRAGRRGGGCCPCVGRAAWPAHARAVHHERESQEIDALAHEIDRSAEHGRASTCSARPTASTASWAC